MENLTRRMAGLRITSPPKRKRNNEERTSRKSLKNITGARIRRRFTGITVPISITTPITSRRAPIRAIRPPPRQNFQALKSNYEKMKQNRQKQKEIDEDVIKRIGLFNAALANTRQKHIKHLNSSYNPNLVKSVKMNSTLFKMLYQLSDKNRRNKYSNAVKNTYKSLMHNNYINNAPTSYSRLYNSAKKSEKLYHAYQTWKSKNNKRNSLKPLLNAISNVRPIKSKPMYLVETNMKSIYNKHIPANSQLVQIYPKNKLTLLGPHINKGKISGFIKFITYKK